jgi:hypothetical protein
MTEHRVADFEGGFPMRPAIDAPARTSPRDHHRARRGLHVLDARDPDAVRREQLDSYERRQRRVFP